MQALNCAIRTGEATSADLLHGAKAIADFLGLTPRQLENRIAASTIPTFKIGRTVCARRSSLLAWLAELEQKSRLCA